MNLSLHVLAAALLVAAGVASADDATATAAPGGNAVRATIDPATGMLTSRPAAARDTATPAVSKSGQPLRETYLEDGTHIVSLDHSYRHTMRVSARDGALATSCDMTGTDTRADAFATAVHDAAAHDAGAHATPAHDTAGAVPAAPRERR
jgi:hypothetical protein